MTPRVLVLHASELAVDAGALSPAERAAVATLPAIRRDEWIRGRCAIKRVLGPTASTTIAGDGAPRLEADPRHVSLAHDGAWFAVAVADAPIGIDLCRRAHASRVAAVLGSLGIVVPDPVAGWAALEAVLKLRRWSIDALLGRDAAVAAAGDRLEIRGLGAPVYAVLICDPAYVAAWAVDGA
ncbi:MAG TPA: hypothetical protein VFQ53_35450 [Kofleriaceae bacterium]|nr:hypothetical protein [Kofleriaceae bacterium]